MEDDGSLERAVQRIEMSPDEKVLLLRANHVVDKHTLAGFLEKAGDVPCCLVQPGSTGLSEGICLVEPREVLPNLRMFLSGEEPEEEAAERIDGTGRLPLVMDGRWNTAAMAKMPWSWRFRSRFSRTTGSLPATSTGIFPGGSAAGRPERP